MNIRQCIFFNLNRRGFIYIHICTYVYIIKVCGFCSPTLWNLHDANSNTRHYITHQIPLDVVLLHNPYERQILVDGIPPARPGTGTCFSTTTSYSLRCWRFRCFLRCPFGIEFGFRVDSPVNNNMCGSVRVRLSCDIRSAILMCDHSPSHVVKRRTSVLNYRSSEK